MKMIRRGSCAALFALCGLFTVSASAEMLNIPASAAHAGVDDAGYDCYYGDTFGFVASTDNGNCTLDFPLMIPAGHTINQIGIVHSDNSLFPDPFIEANLVLRDTNSGGYVVEFPWSSSTPLPPGTVQTGLLMKQVGKMYPDAFIVQTGSMYHVMVQLNNGASNLGVWVVYQ